MLLKDYFPNIEKKFEKTFFSDICFESSKVKKDSVFFAIKGTNIDTSYIMEQEIEKLAHKFMIDSVTILQAYLPQILEAIAADLRLQLDEKYKEQILNGNN